MKKVILTLLISISLFANIEIKQNMKALYKNIELSEKQENYIFDNQEICKRILSQQLKKTIKGYTLLNEKNVVRFTIKPNGKISNISFLQTSGNTQLDRTTKRAVKIAAEHFPRPQEETEMRYIIEYNIGKRKIYYENNSKNEKYYQNISRGTTRFNYSSKEYIREFEVSEDGFINLKNAMCANIQILTMKNQRVSTGYNNWRINEPIKKGKYKLLIRVKKDCDIDIQYP